ncbi:MAG: hypothetical protein M1820_007889 [Bogoriella megaspora]|nr:MAG: hypothetical protein M1820_007889 [Bogoriella megaspora]
MIFKLPLAGSALRIHSLAPNYAVAPPSKVATVTFQRVPDQLAGGAFGGSFALTTSDLQLFRGDNSVVDEDDGFLYQLFLHQVRLGIDVKFEGLTPLRSFRDRRSHEIDSDSFQDVTALAGSLRKALRRLKEQDTNRQVPRPLVFIAHSLGGILIKEALVQMQDDPAENCILKSVVGALFFGVPNKGMDISSLSTMVRSQPNEHMLQQIGPLSNLLPELQVDFGKLVGSLSARIVCFYETMLSPTAQHDPETGEWKMTGPPAKLVDPESARYGTLRDNKLHQVNPINR